MDYPKNAVPAIHNSPAGSEGKRARPPIVGHCATAVAVAIRDLNLPLGRVCVPPSQPSRSRRGLFYFLNDYTVNRELPQNSFISATLCWDRTVTLNDTDNNGLFTTGETFTNGGVVDLDLQLLEDIDGSWSVVDLSNSSVDSTEHIFFQLPTTGEYMLRVAEFGSNDSVPYGLAWWAVPEPGAPILLLAWVYAICSRGQRRYSTSRQLYSSRRRVRFESTTIEPMPNSARLAGSGLGVAST